MSRIRPWLWFPTSIGLRMVPTFLNLYGRFAEYHTLTWKPLTWRGLEFSNPLGVAAGLDKNAEHIRGWWALGAGFVEVGTVVPRPQASNPGLILRRDVGHRLLWNKMGFPSEGVDAVKNRLKPLKFPHFTPIFVNIGRNRSTPNEKAHHDYIVQIKDLAEFADAFVVNISSPNTQGLRDLQSKEALQNFLSPIMAAHKDVFKDVAPAPVLLKLSPDLGESELSDALEVSRDLGINGWVLGNTTTSRTSGLSLPTEGGVSGAPLAKLAKTNLERAVRYLGPDKKGQLLVSCGGILSAQDVRERLEMGADLLQVYSALVFEGPYFFKQMADEFGPV